MTPCTLDRFVGFYIGFLTTRCDLSGPVPAGDCTSLPTLVRGADMVTMTSDATQERSYACVPCDVTWKSADTECWMCGTDVTVAVLEKSLTNASGAARMMPTPTNYASGTRLTRWGTSFLEAQARGLPDPRYQPTPNRTLNIG